MTTDKVRNYYVEVWTEFCMTLCKVRQYNPDYGNALLTQQLVFCLCTLMYKYVTVRKCIAFCLMLDARLKARCEDIQDICSFIPEIKTFTSCFDTEYRHFAFPCYMMWVAVKDTPVKKLLSIAE